MSAMVVGMFTVGESPFTALKMEEMNDFRTLFLEFFSACDWLLSSCSYNRMIFIAQTAQFKNMKSNVLPPTLGQKYIVTLSAKSSLFLGENKAAFHKEGHIIH